MGISLPRTVSNTDSCLIPHKLCRCRIPENLAQPDFLIPCLDQRSPFADWIVSPRYVPVNRGFSVYAIGCKTGFNINSPATGGRKNIRWAELQKSEVRKTKSSDVPYDDTRSEVAVTVSSMRKSRRQNCSIICQ